MLRFDDWLAMTAATNSCSSDQETNINDSLLTFGQKVTIDKHFIPASPQYLQRRHSFAFQSVELQLYPDDATERNGPLFSRFDFQD